MESTKSKTQEAPAPIPVPPPDRNLPDRLDLARDAVKADLTRRSRFVALITSVRLWGVIVLLLVVAAVIFVPYYFWYTAPELDLKVLVVSKTVPFVDRREHRGHFWLLGQNKIVDTEASEEQRFYDFERDYVGFFPERDFDPDIYDPDEYGRPGEALEADGATAGEPAGEGSGEADTSTAETEEPGGGGLTTRLSGANDGPRKPWSTIFTYNTLNKALLLDRDVLYFADTYGVYTGDYWQFPGEEWAHTKHTRKIYGGMEEQEVEAAEWFASRGKLIIAEFNTFGSPTPDDLRFRMEDVLGVSWTRWIGRYFIDFSDEKDVPYWLYELYYRAYGREWDVTGSGYMLCRDEAAEFVILKDGEDVEPLGLQFVPREEYAEVPEVSMVMRGVKPCTFSYWFDILVPHRGTEVLADYQFHLTEQGRRKLAEHGLGTVYPAVARKEAGYTAYYMAGDMVDFNKAMGTPRTRLTLFINRSFYRQHVQGGQGYFFWHTYYPLITNIMRVECQQLSGQPEDPFIFD